jgi:hypothetical protein
MENKAKELVRQIKLRCRNNINTWRKIERLIQADWSSVVIGSSDFDAVENETDTGKILSILETLYERVYENCTVIQLRGMCQMLSIKGYQSASKDELIANLRKHYGE